MATPIADQDAVLAAAPAEDLLDLDFVKRVKDTPHAYQMSKRCNSLRARGEAVNWGKCGARINAISPGITDSRSLSFRQKDKYDDLAAYTKRHWK